MGWFASGIGAARRRKREPSLELLHRLGCKICPLDKLLNNKNPHIPAHGSERPDIYILGEAPGATEDRTAENFSGDSGLVLRAELSDDILEKIRWNNVVRTRPPENRDPAFIEIECCRPSIVADIVETKPKVIFGFGNAALNWATGHSGIMAWRGRRTPVNIGGHVCWFYPMQHPASILHEPNENRKESIHQVFKWDLQKALAEYEHLPEPEVHDREIANYGIEFAYGNKEGDLKRVEAQLRWAMKQDEVGLDIETKNLRPYAEDSKILTVAIGSRENSFAFALGHSKAKWTKAELKRLRELMTEFLRSKARKVVHFLRFEMEWFADRYGWDIVYDGCWGGTETQAAVIDERSGAMSLDFLVQQYFGFDLKALSPLDKNNLDDEPIEDVLWYNAADAKYHLLLWQAQQEIIERRKFQPLYDEMIARVPSCVLTQLAGLPVNAEIADTLAAKYQEQADAARADVMAAPQLKHRSFATEFKGKAFKPLSDDHCVKLFRHVLGRTEGLANPKSNLEHQKFKVDEEVLTKIGLPICKDILRLRKATKKLSTYIYRNNEKKTIIWPDGLLHPNFNTVRVRTKRLCLREGTRVTVPGGYKNIEDIRKGDWVYSFDNNKQLTLKQVLWSGYTGRKPCFRVHWVSKRNNAGYLDATGNHQIRLVDGSYIAIRDLKGATLYEGNRKTNRKDCYRNGEHVLALHRHVRERSILWATNLPKDTKEARFVFETIQGWSPEEVHHRNHNPADDRPSNLQGMRRSDHKSLHMKLVPHEELSRRMRNRSAEALKRNAEGVVKAIKQRAANRFTKRQILDAVRQGNGVVGAAKLLGCDYGAVRWRMNKWKIEHDGRRNYNHMITEIETLPSNYKVYDIEVEDTHNFIANEICVHNSCDDPNVQNIPKRDEDAKEIRAQIEAPEGLLLCSADHGQIQARGIAMSSQDKQFCQALWERFDVHGYWAERIATAYPRRVDNVTNFKDEAGKKVLKKFRGDIKNQWTFPLFFGARLERVADELHIPANILEPEYEAFTTMFAGVFQWHAELVRFYNRNGYVEDLFGFRHHAPLSKNEIINSPIQSLEALFVMRGMNNLSRHACATGDWHYQPIAQIHDDLTFLLPENNIDKYVQKIVTEMLGVTFPFVNIPMTLEVSIGPDLLNMQEMLTISSDDKEFKEWKNEP